MVRVVCQGVPNCIHGCVQVVDAAIMLLGCFLHNKQRHTEILCPALLPGKLSFACACKCTARLCYSHKQHLHDLCLHKSRMTLHMSAVQHATIAAFSSLK